jgi:hypothetical protein
MLQDERGTALVAVLLLSLVLVPLAMLAYLTANVEVTAEANKLHGDQALALADAGLAVGVDWLFKQAPPPQPPTNDPIDLGEAQLDTYGSYGITVDPDDANDYTGPGPWVYTITAVGRSAFGGARTVSQIVQIDPLDYGDWLYFFDHMSAWFHNDRVAGRLYVKQEPWIATSNWGPIFMKRVDTSAGQMRIRTTGFNGMTSEPAIIEGAAHFYEGWNLNAPPIDLPEDTGEIEALAELAGRAWNGNVSIVLNDDGTMDVKLPGQLMQTFDLLPPPHNCIHVRGNLDISGTLNGQLVCGATGYIRVPDDLVYNEDPRLVPDSNDKLGLVAKGDFVIGQKPGGGDHLMHGRILAMAKWRTERQNADREGFWRFFGSLAAANVGATEPRLDTDAEHDWREPPPGFPGTGLYDKEEVGNSWVELYK